MTEISDAKLLLSPALERFVLHWGDMGGAWGVNRSVAQIHALLLIAGRPLAAEEIAETLGIARSNVSTSLKELLAWDLARKKPVLGDRRDFFEAEGDIWEMATKIVAIRKAREIDPAAALLRDCVEEAKQDPATPKQAAARLAEMQDLVDTLNNWYEQMNKVPKSNLLALIRLGSKAVDLLAPFVRKKGAKAEN